MNADARKDYRIPWIDFAKGAAIYLVVLGHVIQYIFPENALLFKIIYSFHMPLFFVLSGFTFTNNTEQSYSVFVKNKIKSLGKPYLLFLLISIIEFSIKAIIRQELIWKWDTILNTILLTNESIFSHLWFFPTLFTAECILFFILKYTSNRGGVRSFIILLLVLIGFLYSKQVGVPLHLSIDVAMVSAGYIYLGILARNQDTHSDAIPLYAKIVISVFLFIVLIWVNGREFANGFSSADGYYKLDIFHPYVFLLASLLGSTGVIGLASSVKKTNIVCCIGRNSGYIYGMHFYCLKCLSVIVNRIHIPKMLINDLFTIMLAIFVTLMTYYFILIFQMAFQKILNRCNCH